MQDHLVIGPAFNEAAASSPYVRYDLFLGRERIKAAPVQLMNYDDGPRLDETLALDAENLYVLRDEPRILADQDAILNYFLSDPELRPRLTSGLFSTATAAEKYEMLRVLCAHTAPSCIQDLLVEDGALLEFCESFGLNIGGMSTPERTEHMKLYPKMEEVERFFVSNISDAQFHDFAARFNKKTETISYAYDVSPHVNDVRHSNAYFYQHLFPADCDVVMIQSDKGIVSPAFMENHSDGCDAGFEYQLKIRQPA